MPDITALTRDDIALSFSCPSSSNLLEAAEEAGFYLPSVCRHGRCGTCRATVLSGSYSMEPHEAPLPAIPGTVLLCRCHPRENLTVALPCRDAQIGRRQLPRRRAAIQTLTPFGAGALALRLRLLCEGEHGQEAAFIPGQSMRVLGPGGTLWQSLAMANLPNEEGLLDFLLAPDEALPWAGAKPGAVVQLRGPEGKWALDDTSPRPRCLIGTGPGAPLIALLRELAARRDRTRLHLILQAADAEAQFLERLLSPLRPALPQLMVTLLPGGPAAALHAYLAKIPCPDIYTAGPAPLLAAVTAVAMAHGLPLTQLHAYAGGGARSSAAEHTGA